MKVALASLVSSCPFFTEWDCFLHWLKIKKTKPRDYQLAPNKVIKGRLQKRSNRNHLVTQILTISPLNPISRYSKDIILRKSLKKGENLTKGDSKKGGEVERTNDWIRLDCFERKLEIAKKCLNIGAELAQLLRALLIYKIL